MKKRTKRFFGISGGVLVIILILTMMLGTMGTGAWFSDQETSNGNSLTAGILDLTIDGGDTNVVKFTVNPFVPGDQPNRTFELKNEGNIPGYLDIESIVVTDHENGRKEPEIEAGDSTPNIGELSSIVSIRLMHDKNGDGWLQTGDVIIYDGKIKNIGSNYDSNILIGPGETVYINILINWHSTTEDNTAQSDSTDIDFSFELGQKTSQ